MANESCDPTPAPSEPVKPGTRMVKCVKFGKELPGLDRIPWQGELGKRVYENVSKDAWKLWIEYSKMVMNEYRLNPLDPNSQKIMGEQMEQFSLGKARNYRKDTFRQRPKANQPVAGIRRVAGCSTGRRGVMLKRNFLWASRMAFSTSSAMFPFAKRNPR